MASTKAKAKKPAKKRTSKKRTSKKKVTRKKPVAKGKGKARGSKSTTKAKAKAKPKKMPKSHVKVAEVVKGLPDAVVNDIIAAGQKSTDSISVEKLERIKARWGLGPLRTGVTASKPSPKPKSKSKSKSKSKPKAKSASSKPAKKRTAKKKVSKKKVSRKATSRSGARGRSAASSARRAGGGALTPAAVRAITQSRRSKPVGSLGSARLSAADKRYTAKAGRKGTGFKSDYDLAVSLNLKNSDLPEEMEGASAAQKKEYLGKMARKIMRGEAGRFITAKEVINQAKAQGLKAWVCAGRVRTGCGGGAGTLAGARQMGVMPIRRR